MFVCVFVHQYWLGHSLWSLAYSSWNRIVRNFKLFFEPSPQERFYSDLCMLFGFCSILVIYLFSVMNKFWWVFCNLSILPFLPNTIESTKKTYQVYKIQKPIQMRMERACKTFVWNWKWQGISKRKRTFIMNYVFVRKVKVSLESFNIQYFWLRCFVCVCFSEVKEINLSFSFRLMRNLILKRAKVVWFGRRKRKMFSSYSMAGQLYSSRLGLKRYFVCCCWPVDGFA